MTEIIFSVEEDLTGEFTARSVQHDTVGWS